MKPEKFLIHTVHWILTFALGSLFSISVRAQNTSPQVLKSAQPSVISDLSATGRLASETRLNLSVVLPLRNENALDSLLGQLYNPTNPNYHHYLTHQQFIEQFAPSAADYRTVADFFGTNGFTVVQHPDRMVLDVSGASADVERVFHV